jgi:hypothetical protein
MIMRTPWIQARSALAERLAAPEQVGAPVPDAQMPPYMESFLAHLRLLVGVPFDYLVPDARLLPTESIRFFYLDRSWTDRLVDGAIAVGKIGSREQAHHQARAGEVTRQLDVTERSVRDLQRSRLVFEVARANPVKGAAQVVTGFLLRSAAVSGWPHMDVRAYSKILDRNFDPGSAEATAAQLRTLRLERLAPAVMLALFQGIPRMVMCEEPHHGIQFGVKNAATHFYILRRDAAGMAIAGSQDVTVPLRKGGRRVVHMAELRRRLEDARTGSPAMPVMNGAGAMAVELLNRPWRQRFQGDGARPQYQGTGRYVADFQVIARAGDPRLKTLLEDIVK